MKHELVEDLKNRYPKILEKSYDFLFEDGWLNLIETACFLIKSHLELVKKEEDFKLTQIKEKFGGLRMYHEGYCDDYINGVLHTVESLSFRTCEFTGNVGATCFKGGWRRTLSVEKMEDLGFSPTKGLND